MLRVSLEINSQIWGMLTEKSTYYHIMPMHDHILGVQESILEEFSIKEKGFKIKKLFLVLKITKKNYKAFHSALQIILQSFDQRVRKREITHILSI